MVKEKISIRDIKSNFIKMFLKNQCDIFFKKLRVGQCESF